MANNKSIYGLIGYPLGHSFSKSFFTKKFESEGINAEYRNFEIDNIAHITEILGSDVCGLNVTIPYKEKVIPFLDGLDTAAEKIGAVNVIKITNDNGKTKAIGYNSDMVGFANSIKPLLKDEHKKALILGTGGASKAVKYALESMNIECLYVSRKASDSAIAYEELSSEIMKEHLLIVNTTPLGMYPKIDLYPNIPYVELTNRHICYDLTYNPEVTSFMRLSKQRGATVKNGLEMLILQAIESWRIWHL